MIQRPSRRQEWSISWCMNYLFEFLLGILGSNGNFTLHILQLSLQKGCCCLPVFQKQCFPSRHQLFFSNSLSCLNGSDFQCLRHLSLIIDWNQITLLFQFCAEILSISHTELFSVVAEFLKKPQFSPLWLIVKLRSVLSLC